MHLLNQPSPDNVKAAYCTVKEMGQDMKVTGEGRIAVTLQRLCSAYDQEHECGRSDGSIGRRIQCSSCHLACLEAISKPDGTLVGTVSLNDSSPPPSINAAAEKPGKIRVLGPNLPQVVQQHAQARGRLKILGRAFPGSSRSQRPQLTSEIFPRSRRQLSLRNKPLYSPIAFT